MKRLLIAAMLLLAAAAPCRAQHASAPDPLRPLAFLVGSWTSVESSGPVRSRGTFSIRPELGGKVLLRRDHTEFVAADGRTSGSMDVMMTIYVDPATQELRAVYFDSGGRVIHYRVGSVTPDSMVQFVSEPSASAPTFR